MQEKAERWESILKEWEESGLSASKYCKLKKYTYKTFTNWRMNLRGYVPEKRKKKWIEVKNSPKERIIEKAPQWLEIETGDVKLKVPIEVSADNLKDIMIAVKSSC